MPSRAAARHTSDASPDGSAAASCSSRRAGSGSASIWRPKLSSIRPVSGDRAAEPEPARQLRRGQPARQLEQGQRVAVRIGDDLLPDPRVQRAGQHRFQQQARVALGQAADGQLGQARHVLIRDPRGEDQAHRVGGQPPGDEAQRLGRGPVQPVLVVDDADQRVFAGRLGEQAEHGQADQEPVRRRPGAEPERGTQRLVLRGRQAPGPAQQRGAQLVQAGEGQLHLRLHARPPGPRGTPPRARPGTPAGRSCPPPARRAPPGPGPRRPARGPRTGPAPGVRCAGRSARGCGRAGPPGTASWTRLGASLHTTSQPERPDDAASLLLGFAGPPWPSSRPGRRPNARRRGDR